MPNWTLNTIDAKGIENLNIYSHFDGAIDFDKIIPAPKTKEDCEDEYILKGNDGVMPDADKPWFNWYTWNINHWGTKWNACDGYTGVGCIEFNTAWSAPFPIFSALSKKLGNEPMYVTYYDEDYDGHHHLTYINGVIVDAYDEVLTMNEDGEWEGDD